MIKKYAEKEEDLLDALIDETKKKGAPDNITILWAQIVDEAPKNDIELIGAAL